MSIVSYVYDKDEQLTLHFSNIFSITES